MLLSRAPFRASIVGGGTDIPWFYEKHGRGAVLSFAINRYVYVSIRPSFFRNETLLKYSRLERVESLQSIQHPIFRSVLQKYALDGVEIGVTSDIPAGTGLGSSSTFTVALLRAVHAFTGREVSRLEVAAEAFEVEYELSNGTIGKQDQYASAMGGLNRICFSEDGSVEVEPVELPENEIASIENQIFLVFTGSEVRSASEVLKRQRLAAEGDPQKVLALVDLRNLADIGTQELRVRGSRVLGGLLQKAWDLKTQSTTAEAISVADGLIQRGVALGAESAKLLGAGGGGFILFWVPLQNREKFLDGMKDKVVLKPKLDFDGVKVAYRSQDEL